MVRLQLSNRTSRTHSTTVHLSRRDASYSTVSITLLRRSNADCRARGVDLLYFVQYESHHRRVARRTLDEPPPSRREAYPRRATAVASRGVPSLSHRRRGMCIRGACSRVRALGAALFLALL